MVNSLSSERGAGAIIIALVGVVAVSVVIATLPSKVTELAKDHRRLQSMIVTTAALQDAGKLVLDARVKGFDVDTNGLANCPAAHTRVNLRDSGAEPLKTYCFPDAAAGRCFANPLDLNGAQLCIDLTRITANNELPSLRFKPNGTKLQKAELFAMNYIRKASYWLAQEMRWIPVAEAQITHLPPAPVAAVANNSTVRDCSVNLAAAPTNDAVCEYCTAANSDCVRIQICEPGSTCIVTNDYFNQRILLYMGD